MSVKTRIFIVDDHPLLRRGLAELINREPDMVFCGEAEDSPSAMKSIAQIKPDLVIVDIALKRGHGIDLVKEIKTHFPDVKTLVLSGFHESLYAERALRAGALGYLNKQESSEKMLVAIRTCLDGNRYVSPEITERLVGKALNNTDIVARPIDQLTDRELEIFRMIGHGMSTGVIANDLFLSTHTIDTHRENIKRKLGLKNAAELTRAAVQWILEAS